MANKKHKFIVNKSEEAIWEKGLRSEFEYRDLGIREATSNEFGAQVIRMTEGGLHEATGKHSHLTNFQMFYVLEGEAKFYFDNEGEITVKKGDCYYQPDGLIHDALYMSDDCKLLEITAPADFETKIY
ncbi:MAG: cupin [Rhodospirillaceae bacterium]|nr:cupin [Rhodospirillaceae bacterium]|tara:strand:+ start:157 stop:540 length:384 start_codon:yes stop_codon:yes gene_type:complete